MSEKFIDTALQIAVLFVSIILHEVAHGYAAWRLGDPTARMRGRLSLNPLAHIDLFGSVLLPLMLVLSRSPVLLAWAKPVPVEPGFFRNPRKGMMLVGAAGPLTNLALAVVSAAVVRLFGAGLGLVSLLFIYGCVINVMLALFNLVPVPPLDGSRIALGLIPRSWVAPYLRLERFGFILVFALLWFGLIDVVVEPLFGAIVRVLLPMS